MFCLFFCFLARSAKSSKLRWPLPVVKVLQWSHSVKKGVPERTKNKKRITDFLLKYLKTYTIFLGKDFVKSNGMSGSEIKPRKTRPVV